MIGLAIAGWDVTKSSKGDTTNKVSTKIGQYLLIIFIIFSPPYKIIAMIKMAA